MRAHLIITLASALLLGGCASGLSGIGGSSSLSCPFTDGVVCKSMSDVYDDTVSGRIPPKAPTAGTPPENDGTPRAAVPRRLASAAVPSDLLPLRTPARVREVWIAPWEDSDGDLNGDSRIYLQIDNGRWNIEHARASVRREFSAIRPPANAPAAVEPAAPATPMRNGGNGNGALNPFLSVPGGDKG